MILPSCEKSDHARIGFVGPHALCKYGLCRGGGLAFGMGRMLRATLQIGFMHQTLACYASPSAAKTFRIIREDISGLRSTLKQQQSTG
ncbi:hypothetical protein EDD17DRAFT_1622221 [Pisolithus thermaeus]|nr:hypothetical protein EDD17DRAFT_1622221 [Pisolithus thermaeus]